MNLLILTAAESGGGNISAFRMFETLSNCEGIKNISILTKKDLQYCISKNSKNIFLFLFHKVAQFTSKAFLRVTRLFHYGYPDLAIVPTPHDAEIIRISSNFDFVIVHWVQQGFMSLFGLIKLSRNKPVILVLHDEWIFRTIWHHSKIKEERNITYFIHAFLSFPMQLISWMLKNILVSRAFALVSPSDWMSLIAKEHGTNHAKIVKIPNYLPIWLKEESDFIRSVSRVDSRLRIGFVSHGKLFHNGKNFKDLLEACRLLHQRGVELILVVTGAKSVSPAFPEFVSFQNRTQKDMADFYNAIDILVIPSKIDNIPLVGIEAQASGIFVIASTAGGTREVLTDAKSGCVYVGGPKELADTIELALKQFDLTSWHRIRRATLSKFNDIAINSMWIDLLKGKA